MSAFEGTPLPPQCGRHKWKPPPLFHSSQTQICRFRRLTMEIRVESEPERIAKLHHHPVLSAKGDVFVTNEGVYREVQLDLTPEMKVLHRVGEYLRYSIERYRKYCSILIHVSYLYLRCIFSQLLLMVSVSNYLKDTEDTAFRVSVS